MTLLRQQLVWREAANKTVDKLQENIRSKAPTNYGPMDNTGRAAESIEYRWLSETRLQIVSRMPGVRFNYIMTLETGRKPGKMPPPDSIQSWIEQRGIQPSGISQKSLAFLIARKIGREGSLVYRKGGNTGIISEVQREEWIVENFIKPIEQDIKQRLTEEIKTF